LVAPPNPGAISPSSIIFFLVSFFCPSQPRSYIKNNNKKNIIDEGYIAPGWRGANKTNKKNTIDEGYIAPGLRGAKKKH
jgi:hypothetical protein